MALNLVINLIILSEYIAHQKRTNSLEVTIIGLLSLLIHSIGVAERRWVRTIWIMQMLGGYSNALSSMMLKLVHYWIKVSLSPRKLKFFPLWSWCQKWKLLCILLSFISWSLCHKEMTPMLPLVWIMVLLHLWVGLTHCVILKWASWEIEGLLPPLRGEHLEWGDYCLFQSWTPSMGKDKPGCTYLPQGQASRFPHDWSNLPVHPNTPLWLGGP